MRERRGPGISLISLRANYREKGAFPAFFQLSARVGTSGGKRNETQTAQ